VPYHSWCSNDPFEEGVREKTLEKKSRAWCCCSLLESGQKRLLPILTWVFFWEKFCQKWAFFFSFFCFFVENGDLKKKKCFPGFLVTRFQKRNFNFHIFVISSGRVAKQIEKNALFLKENLFLVCSQIFFNCLLGMIASSATLLSFSFVFFFFFGKGLGFRV